jgi:hypothetical protein
MRESYAETLIPSTGKEDIPYPSWAKIAGDLLLYGAEVANGTVEGTGALISIVTAFDPELVLLWNVDGLAWEVKTPAMGVAAQGIKFITNGTMSALAVNGVTLGVKGFSIGADADLNVAAETIHWIAFGAKGRAGSSREAFVPSMGKDAVPYPTNLEALHQLFANGAEVFFGSFTADAAAKTLALPFDPVALIVVNETNAVWAVGTKTLAAAEMVLFSAGGVMSYEAANGFTLGTKQAIVGANATLNVAASKLHYIAIGKGFEGSFAKTQLPLPKNALPYPSYIDLIRGLFQLAGEMVTGSVASTGAGIDVVTPFDPAAVFLFNRTGLAWSVSSPSMTSGDGLVSITNGDMTFEVAGVITLGEKKFTIGTNADLNPVGAEVIHYGAFGSRPVQGSN